MNIMVRPIIGVVGKGDFNGEFQRFERIAEEVGEVIASKGYWLLCGGLAGVMEAAPRGAKSKGGLTIGILPTAIADINDENESTEWPNSYIDMAIFTGLDGGIAGRNKVIVSSCDAIIALPGSDKRASGTRSEIEFALSNKVPIILHQYWKRPHDLDPISSSEPLQFFATAVEAVDKAIEAIGQRARTTKLTTSRRS